MGRAWIVGGLALVVGGAWIASRRRPPALPEPASVSALHADVTHAEPRLVDPESEEDAQRASAQNDASAPSVPQRAAADGLWVRGRVVFPPGTPNDECAQVVARGRRFPTTGERSTTAAVRADGSFEVAFSPRTSEGRLQLVGRYLFLPSPVSVDPHDGAQVVLEPRLGGRIAVRVVAPDAVDLDAVEDLVVRATTFTDEFGIPCRVSREAGGTFSVDGLSSEFLYRVELLAPGWSGEGHSNVSVVPGDVTELELELTRGVHLAGRVVDSEGEPLAGVLVRSESWWSEDTAVYPSEDTAVYPSFDKTRTDEEGVFELHGIRAGKTALHVQLERYVRRSEDLGTLEDGTRRDDLTLVLDRGGTLRGRVLWPDGRPEAGVAVHATESLSGRENRGHRAETDATGFFEVSGLGDGPYDLTARVASRGGPTMVARAASIRPGGPDTELILEEGGVLSGTVMDDRGAPIPRFSVSAHCTNTPWNLGDASRVAKLLESDDGRFELDGLTEGTWVVSASAGGHAAGREVIVEIPGPGRDLTLVVPRAARIDGRVVDRAGAPVVDALVELRVAGSFERTATSTNGVGEFTFHEIDPGTIGLLASRRRTGLATEVTLAVAPGETRENVRLMLQGTGALEGRVHAAVGAVAGRSVTVDGSRETRALETDAEGRFECEDLLPGSYLVALAQEWQSAGSSPLAPSANPSVQVEVMEGERAQVVLGDPTAQVRVVGTLRCAGASLPGHALAWNLRGGGGSADARTDASGRYEVVLDGPGDYDVRVCGPDGCSRTNVAVPDVAVFEATLDLPTGSIRGVVLDGGSAPLAEIAVYLFGPSGGDEGLYAPTGSDGTFSFPYLEAGPYAVWVGCSAASMVQDPPFGCTVVDAVLDEERSPEELEIRLEPAGILVARVLDRGGNGVRGATLEVRDDHDRVLATSREPTDASGIVRVPGLRPGEVTVVAVLGAGRSEPQSAHVVARSSGSVELVLP